MKEIISFIKDIFMLTPQTGLVGLSGLKVEKKPLKIDKKIVKVKKEELRLSELMRKK